LKLNETSPVGDRVDLNTPNGAAMMRVLLEHQKRYQMPVTMLAMGGYEPFDSPPGEWGMRTHFVDDKGNLSNGVAAWLDFVNAPPYDGPGDVDPPPPADRDGQFYIDRAEKRIVRSADNWADDNDTARAQAVRAGKDIDRALEN
jgi:hypothetical protein